MAYGIIYTLTSTEEEAKKIASIIVQEKLAACVNIIQNVTSVYEWKNDICTDSEYLLFIKTRQELFHKVKEQILQHHSYELPAIIMLPIVEGLEGFLGWMGEKTKND